MTDISFSKILSANDVGLTGGHQGGILVPKGNRDLLAFLPFLDPTVENPDVWITATDEYGEQLELRYVYYNRKLHGLGTRNEYRITYLTAFFKSTGARPGDALTFTGAAGSGRYALRLEKAGASDVPGEAGVIRLTGWRRVH